MEKMRFYQLPPIVAVLPAIGVGWPLVTAQGEVRAMSLKVWGALMSWCA